jgi:hypothetical protein
MAWRARGCETRLIAPARLSPAEMRAVSKHFQLAELALLCGWQKITRSLTPFIISKPVTTYLSKCNFNVFNSSRDFLLK